MEVLEAKSSITGSWGRIMGFSVEGLVYGRTQIFRTGSCVNEWRRKHKRKGNLNPIL